MDIGDRYATRANSPEETPEPPGGRLLEHLSARESIEYLAFSPANISIGVRSPATLLALTEPTARRWSYPTTPDGRAAVAGCAFDDTLLVELTEILLHGQLKIPLCGRSYGSIMCYRVRCYVGQCLPRSGPTPPARSGRSVGSLGDLAGAGPFPRSARGRSYSVTPFRRSLPKAVIRLPESNGQRFTARTGESWLPPAALLTTDRELVLFLEKKVRIQWLRLASFGYIATFFPLARLGRLRLPPPGAVQHLGSGNAGEPRRDKVWGHFSQNRDRRFAA